jgi:outer membrane protein assembly factor BamB
MMTRFALLAAMSLLLVTTQRTSAAENWPQFRGPTGDGHTDAVGLPLTWSDEQNVTWKTPIHGRGWSSPVVWGNQIWLTTATADGKQMFVLCVDRQTGKIVHDLKLFDNEKPRKINKLNSYASPTPVIEKGRIYVHFGSYGTACLDTTDGKVLWTRRDLPCHHWRGPGSSPFLYGEKLIIHYDGYDFQYVVALDKKTGKTIWKKDRDIDYGTTNGDHMKAYCTPIVIDVDGQKQLISPTSKATVALDPATGKRLWKIPYKQFSTTARPLFGHNLLFINTGFPKAELLAVQPGRKGDAADPNIVWRVTKSVPSKPSQLLIDDLLYLIHDQGVATCLDAKTGMTVWSARVGGQYSASPIYAKGRIYCFSHEGKVTVIKPGRKYEMLAQNKLGDGFMASPAVTGKALILRSRTHLYRIEQ